MNDDLIQMSHDEFRAYLLSAYAGLFPISVDEITAKSFAYQYMPQCESGWHPLIDHTLRQFEEFLQKEGWFGCVFIRQIKEKFGSLRIYAFPDDGNNWPEEIVGGVARITGEAERKSAETCEVCGRPGEIGNFNGIYQCLCPEHAVRRGA